MGKLRSQAIRNEPALAHIRPLLAETDAPGSWWDLAFARGTGARQLMVHNHHLVRFQLSSDPGGPVEVRSVVQSPFAQRTFAITDFFGVLRDVLFGLFEWLDRLEETLVAVLQLKVAGWSPIATVPFFYLPVGYPAGTTRYEREYFPIPTCDGSDALPWSITIQSGG